MAVTATVYNIFKSEVLNGGFDLTDDTIKVALCTSSYTPDIDTHEDFADITNEVSGTGYTAGGATLGSKTVTKDTTNNKGVFDAADTAWSSSTITARYAIVYKSTGTAGTSQLIMYIDFGQDESTSDSTFTITWNANGILSNA